MSVIGWSVCASSSQARLTLRRIRYHHRSGRERQHQLPFALEFAIGLRCFIPVPPLATAPQRLHHTVAHPLHQPLHVRIGDPCVLPELAFPAPRLARIHPVGSAAGPRADPAHHRRANRTHRRVRTTHRATRCRALPGRPSRLRKVDGVGTITLPTFVLTLEDPRRFSKSRAVIAFLGLRPGRSQSGNRDPELHITKDGDRDRLPCHT
ncbi:MAG: transposase [Planctomycetota bacterium]